MRPLIRFGWLLLGFIALGLGFAGVVVPLLPTTPFVLLAAFCFARSSPRFHDWLIGHRLFGPLIVNWRRNGSIPRKAKLAAMAAIIGAFGAALLFGAPRWALGVQAVVLAGVSLFILSRPDA